MDCQSPRSQMPSGDPENGEKGSWKWFDCNMRSGKQTTCTGSNPCTSCDIELWLESCGWKRYIMWLKPSSKWCGYKIYHVVETQLRQNSDWNLVRSLSELRGRLEIFQDLLKRERETFQKAPGRKEMDDSSWDWKEIWRGRRECDHRSQGRRRRIATDRDQRSSWMPWQ